MEYYETNTSPAFACRGFFIATSERCPASEHVRMTLDLVRTV